MLYQRAPYYLIIHFLLGFVSPWYPMIGLIALVYQVGQYAFNVRVFPVEGTIKPGNSLEHTSLKILEMLIGYLCGNLLKSYI